MIIVHGQIPGRLRPIIQYFSGVFQDPGLFQVFSVCVRTIGDLTEALHV